MRLKLSGHLTERGLAPTSTKATRKHSTGCIGANPNSGIGIEVFGYSAPDHLGYSSWARRKDSITGASSAALVMRST